jgi:Domain of unknown function (DUF6458)
MGIGASVLVIAVGAVLKFAVAASVAGIDVEHLGLALIIVGDIALMVAVIRSTEPARRRRAILYSDARYLN